MSDTCTYCKKPLRKRYWIAAFVGNGAQCDRVWCRIKTRHILFPWWGRLLRKLRLRVKYKRVLRYIPYLVRQR